MVFWCSASWFAVIEPEPRSWTVVSGVFLSYRFGHLGCLHVCFWVFFGIFDSCRLVSSSLRFAGGPTFSPSSDRPISLASSCHLPLLPLFFSFLCLRCDTSSGVRVYEGGVVCWCFLAGFVSNRFHLLSGCIKLGVVCFVLGVGFGKDLVGALSLGVGLCCFLPCCSSLEVVSLPFVASSSSPSTNFISVSIVVSVSLLLGFVLCCLIDV